jgi:hypothetical protein
MTMSVVDNLRAMVSGDRPPNVVNPEIYGELRPVTSDRTG